MGVDGSSSLWDEQSARKSVVLNVWSMKEYVFGEASAYFTLIEKQAVGTVRNFQIGAKCRVVFTLPCVWNMKKVKHYTMKIE